jgi:hypothetical protein
MYKIHNGFDGYQAIIRIIDFATIPMDEANIDYQDYLKWVNDGNVPEK